MTRHLTPKAKKKTEKVLPYVDNFVTSELWVKETLRKGLRKKSREYYAIKSVNRLADGRYFIELERDWKL